MKKVYSIIWVFLILISNVGFSQAGVQDLSCFSILVGKNASIDGSVMFAHNEDDWGDRIVNWYKVPASVKKQKKVSKKKNVPSTGPSLFTWSYLWLEMPEMEYSDTYMNQWGVTISSDACPSREEMPAETDGGIGYYLRMNMARQATSAREAVKIGGQLVSSLGYNASGRTYCIADTKEVWMLAVVYGKQWVARRIPDNHVAIIPNYYTITTINLEDTLNFYGSDNLVEYAIERNWYNPESDGVFNFRKAYGDPESLVNENNIIRHWNALNILSEMQYPVDAEFPFSFVPKNRVGLTDLFNILRNHNEETEYDQSENYTAGHPHGFDKTICAETTQYGFVAQLRNDLPAETGLVMWISPYRPCVHPFVPWYFGITEIPDGFYRGDYTTALKNHFEPIENVFELAPGNQFLEYVKHARKVDEEYADRILNIRAMNESFENELLRNHGVFQKEVTVMLNDNPEKAIERLNQYIQSCISLSYELMHAN